ncbi:MAG: hypothetical protein FWH21_00545 [Kiritimatiellaeota bacterium]|nr:hypothetical protein [Kiritimatiellota bacterium]
MSGDQDEYAYSYPVGNLHNFGLSTRFFRSGGVPSMTLFVYRGYTDFQGRWSGEDSDGTNVWGLDACAFQGARMVGLGSYLDAEDRMFVAWYRGRVAVLKEPVWEEDGDWAAGGMDVGRLRFSGEGAFLKPIAPDAVTSIYAYAIPPDVDAVTVGAGQPPLFRLLYVLRLSEGHDALVSAKKVEPAALRPPPRPFEIVSNSGGQITVGFARIQHGADVYVAPDVSISPPSSGIIYAHIINAGGTTFAYTLDMDPALGADDLWVMPLYEVEAVNGAVNVTLDLRFISIVRWV